jgi:amidase
MSVDGWTVGLLRQAGTVTLGTTHAPEFGAPCYTHSDVVGRPAVTPYDITRYASGSSGGAAAAVAAGLLPAGHDSDGAGSIRLPAAACGLVGLKPTRGRVSTSPLPSFQSWATEGPLTRTVADAGLLLDVMANPPAGEIHRRERSPSESFVDAALSAPTRPMKIAVWTDNGLLEPAAEIAAAVQQVAATLTDAGHQVTVITNPVPWTDQLVEAFFAVFSGLAASLVQGTIPTERQAKLQDISRWLFERGLSRSAAQHVAATDALAGVAATLLGAVEPYDAVLTPVTTSPTVPVGYFHAEGIDRCAIRMLEWAAYCQMQNWTGQPAIALPTHVSSDGLPIAVQLTAARNGDDALLLSLGRQLEDAFDWARRHPPQWSKGSQ